ncbi:MAG TPA: hypothetical protein VFQ39_09575 [Longimicrobium sp.]|nr:hypothetical protein [Longimicrobium sp.]
MHVYIRENPVKLEMREVDADGLVNEDTGLVPVAFYADGNERPSFRALLPPETLNILRQAIRGPVQLGLLAEEPEDPDAEIQAMVGVSLPADRLPEGVVLSDDDEDDGDDEAPEAEPWRASANYDSWRGDGYEPEESDKTVLLAFAPLVRVQRRCNDFGEELVDLLESALSGATKPSLEARVDRLLGL